MCLGIPGQIVGIIDADDALAMVEVAGVRRPVNVSFILDDRPMEACIGEWVLVHVGFAMSSHRRRRGGANAGAAGGVGRARGGDAGDATRSVSIGKLRCPRTSR